MLAGPSSGESSLCTAVVLAHQRLLFSVPFPQLAQRGWDMRGSQLLNSSPCAPVPSSRVISTAPPFKKLFFSFNCVIMFVSVFVFVLMSAVPEGTEEVLAPWELESQAVVNCPTWVLGTKFKSSVREVCAFNH